MNSTASSLFCCIYCKWMQMKFLLSFGVCCVCFKNLKLWVYYYLILTTHDDDYYDSIEENYERFRNLYLFDKKKNSLAFNCLYFYSFFFSLSLSFSHSISSSNTFYKKYKLHTYIYIYIYI